MYNPKSSLALCVLMCIFTSLFSQDEPYLIAIQKGSKTPVLSVGYSAKGTFMAYGTEAKDLIIQTAANRETVYAHSELYFPVSALLFVTDDELLVSSGTAIRRIDLENNTRKLYQGNATQILNLAYQPTYGWVAGGSYDRKIKIWDALSTEKIAELEGHEKNTLAVAFSPTERKFVSGSLDKTIRVWDVDSMKTVALLEMHSDNIYDIEFHPSGDYFVSASLDQTIRLWDAQTYKIVKTYPGHKRGVVTVAFTPDGEHLLSASYDGTIRLWQVRTGKELYSFVNHEGLVNCLAVHPNGTEFTSGGADGNIITWSLRKELFVSCAMEDEYNAFKESKTVFEERQKGENKNDYEQRLQKAEQIMQEWVEPQYSKYIQELKTKTF